MQLLVKKIS